MLDETILEALEQEVKKTDTNLKKQLTDYNATLEQLEQLIKKQLEHVKKGYEDCTLKSDIAEIEHKSNIIEIEVDKAKDAWQQAVEKLESALTDKIT